MGTCLSKKATNSSSPTALPDPPAQTKANTPDPDKKIPTTGHQEIVKREIFVIKHRRSHEIERRKEEEKPNSDKEQVLEISQLGNVNSVTGFGGNGINGAVVAATPLRTSSCTKEEVDAILIQCGRLSRSSSTGKAGTSENPNFARSGRKFSGSKRSYDFDQEIGGNDDSGGCDEIVAEEDRIHRHRNRQREPRVSSPSSSRRRTPSRERDEQGNSQARSGSRERGSGSGGSRRVSRSPARRSESPITNSNGSHGGNSSSNNANRPGKMVSVPATVPSMAMDESNNGGGGEAAMGGVRRILVKRNVGEPSAVSSRTAASPRNRSPARANVRVLNENQIQEQKQQLLSLSRSNSRKAEISPYRRNPLGDIDNNVAGNDQTNLPTNKSAMQKPNGEKLSSNKVVVAQGIDNKTSTNIDYKTKEQHIVEEARGELHSTTGNVSVTLVPAVTENVKVQTLTRTRSSRRSRDFDINPETLLNPNPSYTSLLLEDIQNFHQKGGGTQQPAFSLPQCLTKACSILEAVADLNSTTSSNFSSTFSEERRKKFIKNNDMEEPEMEVMGDLVEPTLHKYVTLKRGPAGGVDMEEQESSGSNSVAGSQQVNWLNPSFLWEPTLTDSPDYWTSSRSNTRENDFSRSNTRENDFSRSNTRENDFNPLGIQRSTFSESGYEKKREPDNQRNGIGRGRLGSGRSVFSMPNAASAST